MTKAIRDAVMMLGAIDPARFDNEGQRKAISAAYFAATKELDALESVPTPEDVARDRDALAVLITDARTVLDGGKPEGHFRARLVGGEKSLTRLATAAERVPGLEAEVTRLGHDLDRETSRVLSVQNNADGWKSRALTAESERDAARQEVAHYRQEAMDRAADCSSACQERDDLSARAAELEADTLALAQTAEDAEKGRLDAESERDALTARVAELEAERKRLDLRVCAGEQNLASANRTVLYANENGARASADRDRAVARATAAEAEVRSLEEAMKEEHRKAEAAYTRGLAASADELAAAEAKVEEWKRLAEHLETTGKSAFQQGYAKAREDRDNAIACQPAPTPAPGLREAVERAKDRTRLVDVFCDASGEEAANGEGCLAVGRFVLGLTLPTPPGGGETAKHHAACPQGTPTALPEWACTCAEINDTIARAMRPLAPRARIAPTPTPEAHPLTPLIDRMEALGRELDARHVEPVKLGKGPFVMLPDVAARAVERTHRAVTEAQSEPDAPVNLAARRIARDTPPDQVSEGTAFISYEGRPGACSEECAEFVLGSEVGILQARLEAKPEEWSGTYHAANVVMVERTAEAYGYTARVERSADPTWVFATFTPASPVRAPLTVVPAPEGHALAPLASGTEHGVVLVKPAAPDVVWEGDGIKVCSDGTLDGATLLYPTRSYAALARALAEAKRENALLKAADGLSLDDMTPEDRSNAELAWGCAGSIQTALRRERDNRMEAVRKAAEDMRERARTTISNRISYIAPEDDRHVFGRKLLRDIDALPLEAK